MRFDWIPILAVAFYGVTLAAQRLVLGRRRVRTAENLDRGSYRLFDVTGLLSIPAAVVLGFTDDGRVRAGEPYVAAFGLALLVAGTAFRWAAIVTLWRYFTPNVSILEGQRVVRRGLYGLVRHPSYTGLLVRYLGFGLALANWLSAALVFLPLLCATLYRIRVEEEALRAHFGEEYAAYASETKRLVPGIY
ncbi:MAG: isoprenylcysteine carboxylmethyltransferase family protein [Acidobacteria bacterium]|nr:isoprenylcysteine carboxylmethyltransferase family protein [Acidobacteriota bacterium]